MSERSRTRAIARTVAAVLIAVTFGLGVVAPAGADPSWKAPVRVTDSFSSGSIRFVVEGIPSAVEPAVYKVLFTNDSIGPHVLVTYKIPNGTTAAQLQTFLNSDDPPPEGAFFVNDVFAKPGQTHQGKYDVTLPGTYGYFCPIETPSGVPHFNLGFVGVFEVA